MIGPQSGSPRYATVNTIGHVSRSASASTVHAAKNLASTACRTVMGSEKSSSIVLLRRSSAQSRIAIAGTRKMKSSGMFSKKSRSDACRIAKKPFWNGMKPLKSRKITRKTYASGVEK